MGRRMGGQVLVVVACGQKNRRAGVGGGGHVWAGGREGRWWW